MRHRDHVSTTTSSCARSVRACPRRCSHRASSSSGRLLQTVFDMLLHAARQLSLKLSSGRDLATIEPHFDTGHVGVPFVSVLWREWIVAVGVAFADATILTVNEHFTALAQGGHTRGCDGLALCEVDESSAAVACLFTAQPP